MGSNTKIAKNSIILYVRLIITSMIGLYSSRLILQELGVEDFGLYGVIGGIVALMNFLNSSMISTSNRFISVELGKYEKGNVNKMFNTVTVIHILLAALILIVGELLGGWYIRHHLNIPAGKIPDALFVLHFSVLAAVFATVAVPLQGLLTAHEKFNIRSSIEITQSCLHLLLLVMISFLVGNKLRMYSVLVFVLGFVIFLIHLLYVKIKFGKETQWDLNRKVKDYKEVTHFFGWTMFYVLGATGSKQGGVLILNAFFGTALNAANAVGARVFELVYSFVKNLNQAAVPQIMINFSSGRKDQSLALIYNLSKFTFFIMYVISLPILLSINALLKLWLSDVPPYTAIFATLMIIHGLICCLESGFDAAIDATGQIRKTKLYFNIVMLLTLPLIYVLFYYGAPPYLLTVVTISSELLFLVIQLNILKNLMGLNIRLYLSKSLLPVLTVVLASLPQWYFRSFFGQSLMDVLLFSVLSVMLTFLSIFYLGLVKNERALVINKFMFYKQKYSQ